MDNTKVKKPDIVQSFDYYIDREYYKISGGFFFSSVNKTRVDRLEDWVEWGIICEKMPDKILVNGKEYILSIKENKNNG